VPPTIFGPPETSIRGVNPDTARRQEMIRTGDTLENTATGERLTFLATSGDTDGEAVVVECTVHPGGAVCSGHVHPAQSERFAVVEGELSMKVGGKKLQLAAGETASVEPGTAHKFWNAGDEPVTFVCEIRPALQFESLVETMFALAADGKTGKKGMPRNPFRLAVIAQAHFDTVRLPFPPAWMQAVGLAVGAPLGKAMGYGPTYEPEAVVPARPAIA
jgi:mannose-6-phosphate isomerase-like protein (cupin superfamily)